MVMVVPAIKSSLVPVSGLGGSYSDEISADPYFHIFVTLQQAHPNWCSG